MKKEADKSKENKRENPKQDVKIEEKFEENPPDEKENTPKGRMEEEPVNKKEGNTKENRQENSKMERKGISDYNIIKKREERETVLGKKKTEKPEEIREGPRENEEEEKEEERKMEESSTEEQVQKEESSSDETDSSSNKSSKQAVALKEDEVIIGKSFISDCSLFEHSALVSFAQEIRCSTHNSPSDAFLNPRSTNTKSRKHVACNDTPPLKIGVALLAGFTIGTFTAKAYEFFPFISA